MRSCRTRSALLALVLGVLPALAHAHAGEDHGVPKPVQAAAGGAAVGLIGERYEVLVKGPAPVPGQRWEAHVFVADARTNAPLPGLPVQLAFLGEGEVQTRATASSQPGVYEASLTLPKPGRWEVMATVGAADGAEVLALGMLEVAPPAAAGADEHAHVHASPWRIAGLTLGGLLLVALVLLVVRHLRRRAQHAEVTHG